MTEMSPEERVAFLRDWSPETAEAFREIARTFGYELDYSPESLSTVETLIGERFTNWRGKIPRKWREMSGSTAAYVAEVILRNIGGEWYWEDEWQVGGIRFASGGFTSPLAKSRKRFEDGPGDDFVSYYALLAEAET